VILSIQGKGEICAGGEDFKLINNNKESIIDSARQLWYSDLKIIDYLLSGVWPGNNLGQGGQKRFGEYFLNEMILDFRHSRGHNGR
jgi:hypothetical protein